MTTRDISAFDEELIAKIHQQEFESSKKGMRLLGAMMDESQVIQTLQEEEKYIECPHTPETLAMIGFADGIPEEALVALFGDFGEPDGGHKDEGFADIKHDYDMEAIILKDDEDDLQAKKLHAMMIGHRQVVD